MKGITLALLIVLVAMTAWGQQDMGVITGVVTDATGAAIPGAKVTVRNQNTNEAWSTETAGTGTYTAGPMRIGTYEVTVEKDGFKKAVWQGIQLHAQDRVRADFRLELGQVREAVSVSSEAPLLQVESSSLAQVVGQDVMRGLPLNGRNFQQLAWLTAGVTPNTGASSRDQQSGFNAHGQPVTQNTFVIDGIANNSHMMGLQDLKMQVIVPSLDAVAEFKLQTSNYSAEFGRNSGAVMIVSIKSGTNEFHGSAYEYVRNDVFDARDKFNYVDRDGDGKADPEVLRQHQFGATLGGPIRRNRTFFFGSWEARPIRLAQSLQAVVPTPAERSGIFDPRLRAIRDPATGQPFPDNRIPANRFDTTAAKMLDIWPQPNFGGSGTRENYIRNPPWTLDRHQIDVRADHNFSASDRLFARVSLSSLQELRDAILPGFARGGVAGWWMNAHSPARSAVLSYTRILTPNLLNEFRYGFNRQMSDQRELTKEMTNELTARYDIRGIPPSDRLRGLPLFAFSGAIGYVGLGEPNLPNYKLTQVHQYVDNLSWNHGNHNFKFGLDLRYNRSDAEIAPSNRGSLTFDGQFTGISFADFLLGYPAQARLSTWLAGEMRFRDYMFYAQDDWKVTPRVTLNLGLRYDFSTPWYDKHDNQNTLDIEPGPKFGQIVNAGWCGRSVSCRALTNVDTNNWAPRAGLAYQWTPRTVVRSGFGVFYGSPLPFGQNTRGANNFPYTREVIAQSTTTRPALKLSDGYPSDFLGQPTAAPPDSRWIVWQTDFPLSAVYQWNLAVQREIARDLSITIAYVGSASNYIAAEYDWNGSYPGPPATERQRRRIPEWSTISLVSPYGHGQYHGLDLQLERRYTTGLSFSAGYTWGHAIDNIYEKFGAGGGSLQDYRNFSECRANSDFDTRHRFVGAAVYELPFGKGRQWLNRGGLPNHLLGGWQLSGILSLQTGLNFTLSVPNARQRLGATGVGTWWPDRIATGRLETRRVDRWLDASAFVLPRSPDGSWRFGNAGRNILNSDGPFNLNLGLMKSFVLTESLSLQFRAEAFNLTNTPTLGAPVTNVESPDFGKVRSTVSPARQFQFALRLSF